MPVHLQELKVAYKTEEQMQTPAMQQSKSTQKMWRRYYTIYWWLFQYMAVVSGKSHSSSILKILLIFLMSIGQKQSTWRCPIANATESTNIKISNQFSKSAKYPSLLLQNCMASKTNWKSENIIINTSAAYRYDSFDDDKPVCMKVDKLRAAYNAHYYLCS